MYQCKVLFCRSESIVSKLITWFTGEPVSHVALGISLCENELAFHSTLKGVSFTSINHLKKKYAIIAESEPLDQAISFELIERKESASYDIAALLWLGIRFALKKFFRVSIPKANLWQVTGMFTCTELVTKLLQEKEDSLITPFGLLQKMHDQGIKIHINPGFRGQVILNKP